jgi:hypothetical protein
MGGLDAIERKQLARRYNFGMRFLTAAWMLGMLCGLGWAQEKAAPAGDPQSVTVPATIDHNRLVITVEIRLSDGSAQRVRAWVDNGTADLSLSRRVATLLGLNVTCDQQECSSPAPSEITIGGMRIPLTGVKEAKIPLRPVNAALVMATGMNAEINLPASVLRHYDVLIDFPDHKFSIGQPGSIHFRGPSGKVLINSENGLIQIPSKIENKKYNLGLDVGASISLLSSELFGALAMAHATWPHMTGAVGSANMWGTDEEAQWKVMRVDRVQYGPLFLTDVPFVEMPKARIDFVQKRAGMPTAGLIGANVLLNYRVGLDYAHSTVYFEVGRTYQFPDFDVVGLILRPEDDGRYMILGVADIDGQASVRSGPGGVQVGDHLVGINDISVVGATMGEVWSMLGGTPGQERKLTVERGGKLFAVSATVQHFLAVLPDEKEDKKKR